MRFAYPGYGLLAPVVLGWYRREPV